MIFVIGSVLLVAISMFAAWKVLKNDEDNDNNKDNKIN